MEAKGPYLSLPGAFLESDNKINHHLTPVTNRNSLFVTGVQR